MTQRRDGMDGFSSEHKVYPSAPEANQPVPSMALSTDAESPVHLPGTRRLPPKAPIAPTAAPQLSIAQQAMQMAAQASPPGGPAIVVTPGAEGYNEDAHLEYVERLFEAAHQAQKKVEYLHDRDVILRKRHFKENWKKTSEWLDKVSFIGGYKDDLNLIFQTLMGAAIADQAHKNPMTTTFAALLEAYLLINVVQSFGNLAARSYINYSGAMRALEEAMVEKGVITSKDFRLLAAAPSVQVEKFLNAIFLGLGATGITYMGISGGFTAGLVLLSGGVVADAMRGIVHKQSQMRLAEEIKGAPVDEGEHRRSRAYTRVDKTGKYLSTAGLLMLGADVAWMTATKNAQLTNLTTVAVFTGVLGVECMAALAPRLEGSDMVNHEITKLELGQGSERLSSRFLGCKSSTSELDDFLSGRFMLAIIGGAGIALAHDSQISYLAAAACGLVAYYALRGQAHVKTLSVANEVTFWKSSPGRKDIESGKPAPAHAESKAAEKQTVKPAHHEEDDCLSKTSGGWDRAKRSFLQWFTKASESNCLAEAPIVIADRRPGMRKA